MNFSSFRAPLAAAALLVAAAGAAYAQQCRFEVPFALNSAQVPANYEPLLRQIAQVHPQSRITVQGHTDKLGNAAANRALSERRAQAVASALTRNGVQGSNLNMVAFGEDRPVDASTGASQANRRVEVLIEGCRFASATSGTGATTAGPGLGAGAQAGLGALGAAALIGALSGGGTTSTGTTGGT